MAELFKTTVTIDDEIDLSKIMRSGQCFRVRELEDGTFRFITGKDVLYMKPVENDDGAYAVSCSADEWERIWEPYFDLAKNYSKIRRSAHGKTPFVDRAIKSGKGLRILHQDPWEMLVTFIISQRKNMPAIAKAVDTISTRFGSAIETPVETVCAFPTPEQLAGATESDLRDCGLGYRAPYVMDAAVRVASGELDLDAIGSLNDAELFERLQEVHGVGKKVANCICLFGYGRYGQVPVDVWIARAIEEECNGVDPFEQFGEDAGIIQQYVFYHMTNNK